MARDYPRRTGKYKVPASVYHQCVWLIRDYYRLKDNVESLTVLAPIEMEDIPKSQTNRTSDIVFNIVLKRERFMDRIRIIDQAINSIPSEYRKGVWNNLQFNKPYPLDAHRNTYGNYKAKVVYSVAKDLKLI